MVLPFLYMGTYAHVQGTELCRSKVHKPVAAPGRGNGSVPDDLVPGHSLTQSNTGKLQPMSERAVQGKQQAAAWLWLVSVCQLCSEKTCPGWKLPADLTHQAHCAVLGFSGCSGRLQW